MNPRAVALMLTVAAASPALAQSSGGGDREPAGGAFMSSYSNNPYESDRRFPPSAEPRQRDDVDGPASTGSIARTGRRGRR